MNHSYTITSKSFPECNHNNGWYAQIPKRFWGYKQIFVCVDCWSFIDHATWEKDKLKELENNNA